jgi:hypothetical protein
MIPTIEDILVMYARNKCDFAQALAWIKAHLELAEKWQPESEALALLRELNDALAIPGWLQPRVDAVLDGHGVEGSALDAEWNAALDAAIEVVENMTDDQRDEVGARPYLQELKRSQPQQEKS